MSVTHLRRQGQRPILTYDDRPAPGLARGCRGECGKSRAMGDEDQLPRLVQSSGDAGSRDRAVDLSYRRRNDERIWKRELAGFDAGTGVENPQVGNRSGDQYRAGRDAWPHQGPERHASLPALCAVDPVDGAHDVIETGEVHALEVRSRATADFGAHFPRPVNFAAGQLEAVEL